jgi:fatty-acyl-CoA synthase
VVRRSDHLELGEKEIAHYVRGYAEKGVVSKQVVLLKVRFVDVIEKTSVGKVNKVVLREKFLS